MYRKLKLIDTVRVPPKRLDEDVDKVVKEMLEEKLEGRIDRELGMFIAVTDVKEVQEGKIVPSDAGVYYNAEFECINYKPQMQEIIEGEVVEVVDFGAFIGLGPMDALLHVSQITDDYVSHDEKNARLVGKESDFSLTEGDYVKARVIAVSLNEQNPRDSKIGLTMRQPALHKIDKEKAKESKKEVEVKKVEESEIKETESTNEEKTVECRVCGEKFKAITSSHLKKHDLTMDEYKEKYPEAPKKPGESDD
ncbi:MAG: DNA-directed RNA polymerase subunit E'/Rpb7 [Candidatus Methanohalarchaeum thermophilum]|uniref:DNA-directed RNA polymerase subunit Rpo7 n=1 Tax=Methanohalarchaeum thermophilum TaxID=1903181 RepID=A0A1Q6DV53_METT1|nr:MAG: DNA-directed RNA polymerase subunit E'/Rpb7 [Candidatus Methanohalarchaeum thermophilum]